MSQLTLEGKVTIGPPCAVECCGGIDGAEANLPLCVRKPSTVSVGFISRAIASPAAFVALSGVGASDAITQGDFLYVVSDSPMTLRITCDDGSSGTALEVVPIHGLYVRQFSATQPLELVEVKGSGRITYAACGIR